MRFRIVFRVALWVSPLHDTVRGRPGAMCRHRALGPQPPSPSATGGRRTEGGMASQAMVSWFEDLSSTDTAQVGGKNASLGEMIRNLSSQGIRVPGGFAITARSYREFLDANDLRPRISDQIDALHHGATLAEVGAAIRRMFLDADLPPRLAHAIRTSYRELGERLNRQNPDVAAAAPRPRISRRPASPDSRRRSSTSSGRSPCWRHAGAATRPCSPTGRSATANTTTSTTSRWRCPSGCSRWCAPTGPEPV